MSKDSAIAWTDHTFNPWWGCQRVSPGCENCYAEAFAKRVGQKVWGPQSPRRFFGDKHWAEPRAWDLAAANECTRARVFCASMADVFEDREDIAPHRARLFELIEETPSLDWQLLTKRPENILRLVPDDWRDGFPENVWVGTTAENQKWLNDRWEHLRNIPAVVRFLSCEPLLGEVLLPLTGLQWAIVGGESGPSRRDCGVDAIARIVAQCERANIPVFVKQDCAMYPGQQGRIPDDVWARKEFPR